MFVIPCKYESRSPIIECVKSIQKFHSDEKIVIVDSDSDDKSYYEMIDDVEVLDVANNFRLVGALNEAYIKYPNEEYYILIHDSVCLKKKLNFDPLETFRVIMHFTDPFFSLNGSIRAEFIWWITKTVGKIDYPNRLNEYVANTYYGVFGSMGIYSKNFMNILDNKGVLDNLKAKSFNEGQFSERLLGYICKCEGINISNSFDGDAVIRWDEIKEDKLEYTKKLLLSR